jgi:hypothetical protein
MEAEISSETSFLACDSTRDEDPEEYRRGQKMHSPKS